MVFSALIFGMGRALISLFLSKRIAALQQGR